MHFAIAVVIAAFLYQTAFIFGAKRPRSEVIFYGFIGAVLYLLITTQIGG